MKSYVGLDVWIEARKLSKDIYSVTRNFPREEQFGLTGQMRRCAVSVSSNIAEAVEETIPKTAYSSFLWHEALFMS